MMQQLSGLDASFLAMESSTTVGHVTGVLFLDPSTSPEPWTYERFRRHLRSVLADLGPFSRKLVEVPFGLDRPYWINDPDFDLDYHVRHVAVPGAGTREDLADLVARIHARPLDRRRPLWEAYVVDGVFGDKIALITKIHHAAIDGLSGQEILAALVSLDPAEPVRDDEVSIEADEVLSSEEVVGRALLGLVSSPVRLVKVGTQLARALPVLGPSLGRLSPVARGDESRRELVARAGGAPRTPFNATIGPHRRWTFVSVPLADVKAIKNEAGTTVNDVVLTIVAGVLRRWLEDHGGVPDRPLAAMVPLSVRRPDQANDVGNFVSSTISTLATHLDSPAERLRAIHESMVTAKTTSGALGADILSDLTQVAPPAVAALAGRLIASTKLADRMTLPFNVVVSNVPGPPIPLYLAGAEVIGHYPVSAIVDGVGLNITVVSTNGNLDFGFVSDRDLVPDLWEMSDVLPEVVADLAESVGVSLPSAAKPKKPVGKKKTAGKKKAVASKKPAGKSTKKASAESA